MDTYFKSYPNLSMCNDPDDFAVLLHFLEVLFNALFALFIRPSLAGFGECLFLGFVPL